MQKERKTKQELGRLGRASQARFAPATPKDLASTQTEAEEARWFEENQDRLLRLFERAAKDGSLRVGARSVGITLPKNREAPPRPPSQKVMLRIPSDDLERARRQAVSKGIGYQTYIKMLLREGLDRQERRRRHA